MGDTVARAAADVSRGSDVHAAGRSENTRSPMDTGFSSAPKRTRTSTGHSAHKALNLARLPIPPPARGVPQHIRGSAGCDRPGPSLPSRTHVALCLSEGRRRGPHEAPARDLRLHQEVLVAARV